MKEKMKKYFKEELFFNLTDDEEIALRGIDNFLDLYQPDSSKREDFAEYSPDKIDWALDKAFNESMDQNAYDILFSVCRFAKMRYSELLTKAGEAS